MSIDFDLIKLAQSGDDSAVEDLLKKNKNLVVKIARKYFLIGGTEEDIVQEGMIGLFKAIKTFDCDKYTSFSGYASTLISREICNAIRRENSLLKQPLNSCVYVDDEGLLGGVSPENMVLTDESSKRLIDTIKDTLSQFENDVVELYLEGYDYIDIATKLNKTPKQIDNALVRIKTKLRKVRNRL